MDKLEIIRKEQERVERELDGEQWFEARTEMELREARHEAAMNGAELPHGITLEMLSNEIMKRELEVTLRADLLNKALNILEESCEANRRDAAGAQASLSYFFGEFRFRLYAIHTRFDAARWIVTDSENRDELTDLPRIVAQTNTPRKALEEVCERFGLTL